MQHPGRRPRGPGPPPADAPARQRGFPRMPLGMRSWREATLGSGVAPGKLHRRVTKTAPRIGAVFCHTRCVACYPSGSRAFCRFPPAGLPAGTAAIAGPETSPTRPPASPTTNQAPSRKRRQQAPASPCDRYALAPLWRIRRTSDAVRAGQPRAPGRSPPADGARRGRPRAPGRRGYRLGTTASK